MDPREPGTTVKAEARVLLGNSEQPNCDLKIRAKVSNLSYTRILISKPRTSFQSIAKVGANNPQQLQTAAGLVSKTQVGAHQSTGNLRTDSPHRCSTIQSYTDIYN